jgi:hypothetical protein
MVSFTKRIKNKVIKYITILCGYCIKIYNEIIASYWVLVPLVLHSTAATPVMLFGFVIFR